MFVCVCVCVYVCVCVCVQAGCPPCQQAITTTVNAVVNATGVAAIMNLNQIPFGNNYFATAQCGGAPYNPDVRHCWATNCQASSNPASDCFAGTVVTQHGPEENNVNIMEACAKNLVPSWQDYWPFLVCMESNYEQGIYISGTAGCVKSTGFKVDATTLTKCYNSAQGKTKYEEKKISTRSSLLTSFAGQMFLVKEAKQTIDHPGLTSRVFSRVLSSSLSLLSHILHTFKKEPPL